MTSSERPGIDLIAASVEMRPQYPAESGLIRRFADAHSAHTDLASSLDMLIASDQAGAAAEGGLEWARHTVPALIYAAIILYARATKTSSRHRSTLHLAERFDAEQRRQHDRLCAMRDDALAHYGPGEIEAGRAWHEEWALMPLDRPGDIRLMLLSRRLSFAPKFVADAKMHVRRALLLAQQVIEERELKVVAALDARIDDDAFVEILKRCRIDMASIIDRGFIQVLDGDRAGLRTGIVWSK